jgi:hypothetical protein
MRPRPRPLRKTHSPGHRRLGVATTMVLALLLQGLPPAAAPPGDPFLALAGICGPDHMDPEHPTPAGHHRPNPYRPDPYRHCLLCLVASMPVLPPTVADPLPPRPCQASAQPIPRNAAAAVLAAPPYASRAPPAIG